MYICHAGTGVTDLTLAVALQCAGHQKNGWLVQRAI